MEAFAGRQACSYPGGPRQAAVRAFSARMSDLGPHGDQAPTPCPRPIGAAKWGQSSIPSEDNSRFLRLNVHREGNMEAKRKLVEL